VLEPGTKFIPGVHVDAVCLHLQAMIEGRIKDLASAKSGYPSQPS
jgi:hypothetical protein